MLHIASPWTCDHCTARNDGLILICSACHNDRPEVIRDPRKQSRGLGDTIYKITTALHIPHCGGCEQRRQALNALVPYKP